MKNKTIIGSGIRTARMQLGMQQQEFARRLGVSAGYLSEIEAGKKNPGIDLLEKLHESFHIDISFLFTGEGECFKQRSIEKPDAAVLPGIPPQGLNEEEELKWYIDNIPVLRYAMLEFFKSYLYIKRDMIQDELETLRKKKEEKPST